MASAFKQAAPWEAWAAAAVDARMGSVSYTHLDVYKRQQVVLHSGSVVQALRASFALPFMFAPAMIDGQRLVDGCLSDPLPVSVAADAHAVLALGFQTPAPHRVNRPSRLLAQVSASMLNNLMQARLAEASASGQRLLRVEPQLQQRVGLFDTAAMPALVDAGRRATEAALPAIMALLQHEPQRGAARRSAVPGP